MSNGESVFDQPVKNSLKTYDNIWKLATDQWDDYAKCWLLDYVYFKHYYKVIAIDLIKQQARDANPKPLQQINLTGNLDRDGNTTIFFITDKAKEALLDFSQGTVTVLYIYFALLWCWYKIA